MSDHCFFENPRSIESMLARAIEKRLPDTVEKILYKNCNIVLKNDEWDALNLLACTILVNPSYGSISTEQQNILDLKNGLRILEMLLRYDNKKILITSTDAFTKLVEWGIVDYVELCLLHGLKFFLHDLYLICTRVDTEIFDLLLKYGVVYEYDKNSHHRFNGSPILEMYLSPDKGTWGKIKNLDKYLINHLFIFNNKLHHEVEAKIKYKEYFCNSVNQRKKINQALHELQKKYYYDRLYIMQGLLGVVEKFGKFLGGKPITYWQEFVEDYEQELHQLYNEKLSKKEVDELRKFATKLFNDKMENGEISIEQLNSVLEILNMPDGPELLMGAMKQHFKN